MIRCIRGPLRSAIGSRRTNGRERAAAWDVDGIDVPRSRLADEGIDPMRDRVAGDRPSG